jgi:hypothetical protein
MLSLLAMQSDILMDCFSLDNLRSPDILQQGHVYRQTTRLVSRFELRLGDLDTSAMKS